MKCYGVSMIQCSLGLLSVLVGAVGVVGVVAARYADYSVAHMPQYEGPQELEQGMEDYNDKSPDAPARLDYKYEEEQHEKFDDTAIKDIDEERVWDKPRKKTRKTLGSSHNRNFNLDKNSFDDLESKSQVGARFFRGRSRFQSKDFENGSQKHLKHKVIDQHEDEENIEDKNYYIQKEDLDTADTLDDFEIISQLRHRSTSPKKVRRKPRDRALHQPEKAGDNKRLKIEAEEIYARPDIDQYFGSARDPVPITDRLDTNKQNRHTNDYDYSEFYDMKRVQNIKDRLPVLFRQKTVRTTGLQTIRYRENRKQLMPRDASSIETTTENESAITIVPPTKISPERPSPLNASTTSNILEAEQQIANNSDLSLAEKSRLSILKKALKKGSGKNVSTSTKPPVLMQVTRKMQTVVVVEPQVQAMQRARLVVEESPARLQRARRLMRRKLVNAARSIHDLTENWDEMVCDYIDVALLADSVPVLQIDCLFTILCTSALFCWCFLYRFVI